MRRVVRAGSPEIVKIAGGDSSPCSAESSFRELDDVFLQTQTRIWLGEVLHIRFDEATTIADLLADGELLFQVSKLTWKMLLKKQVELTSSKVYIYERTSSGKSDGKYMPYPKVDSFLKICQILGLTGIDLFSPSDVVEKRDVRRVCMCIRSFSKKARLENLNVPDFDKVTYTIAMPTEMVGGIRRTLEKSQYSSSSSSEYSCSSTEPRKSLSEQNTLHYDSYSESDEAESAYTEVEFQTSFSNASYDAAKLSSLMEMDSPEGNLVVDGDLSELQTHFRQDTQEHIEVIDLENFTSANEHFPCYLDGLNVVDAEEENNSARSTSSDSNITLEHPKEDVNTLKCPSLEVQSIISDENSISEQDTVYGKVYEIENEGNAEGSKENNSIATFKMDPSNSTDDLLSTGNNIQFYSINDDDDQRVPSKISSLSVGSVELERKHLENGQKTADGVEVSSEDKHANNDYTADNFSFPQVIDPKVVDPCDSLRGLSANNVVSALIKEASDINDDGDGKQSSSCNGNTISDYNGNESKACCTRDYNNFEGVCDDASACDLDVDSDDLVNNTVTSVEDEDMIGNRLSTGERNTCKKTNFKISVNQLEIATEGEMVSRPPQEKPPLVVGESFSEKSTVQDSSGDVSSILQMKLLNISSRESCKQTTQLMENKISEKEVSSKREIFAEESGGNNQGAALIGEDVGSIKGNDVADGDRITMKEQEECEKPKEGAKGKKVMKSVAGAVTLIGALFLVHHVKQRRAKEKNTEKNTTELNVPQQTDKPSQGFPEQKEVNVVKPVSVYPGGKLKF